ncbi:MAG TPA: helix-turn-helix transcriptional regulator [Asticcacaulis sp.]|nr:helix-turn-helix transcriptional regulator [Asticcacaulis sp.]
MDQHSKIANLSTRQKEILRLIAQHLQAKEVAQLLRISEHTVRTHTDSARRKLGVATSRDAARLLQAFEHETGPAEALVDDQRPSSMRIGEAPAGMAGLTHEQAITHHRKIPAELGLHNPQLAGHGVSPGADSPSVETPEYSGDDGYPSGQEQRGWAETNRSYAGSGDRLADGWWLRFKPRLKRLNTLQWLGVTLILSAVMGILMGAFLAISLGFLETFEHIVRLTG